LVQVLIAIFHDGATREVSGNRCGDDRVDVHLHFNDLRPLIRTGSVQLTHLDAVLLEDLDGAGHLADFVAPIGEGDFGSEIALCKLAHACGNPADRLCNHASAKDRSADQRGDGQQADAKIEA